MECAQSARARYGFPGRTVTVRPRPKSRTRTVPLMTVVSVPVHLSSVSHSVPVAAPLLYLPSTLAPRLPVLRATLTPVRSETFGPATDSPTATRSLRGDERAARFALPS